MSKRSLGAVAVDLGAGSARFAAGWLEEDVLNWQLIERIVHEPIQQGRHQVWDFEKLLALTDRAKTYAATNFEVGVLAIDSWGVDFGFTDINGHLIQAPICYRDPSHDVQFEKFKSSRDRMFEITGIAHQPFNTLYQLAARRAEDPSLVRHKWLMMPQLLAQQIGGAGSYEATLASTTQLMNLEGQWSEELFDLIGCPVPAMEPVKPGWIGSGISDNVRICHVGSHDTASAIYGLGDFRDDTMFLNLGTWSLGGILSRTPNTSKEAEEAGFTNELATDGRYRFLKNLPGFYILDRLFKELQLPGTVAEWLSTAKEIDHRFAFDDLSLYNPASMKEAVSKLCGWESASPTDWASVTLGSFIDCLSNFVPVMNNFSSLPLKEIKLGGGGSQSETICQALATKTGLKVSAGPAEATIIGNLKLSLQTLTRDQSPGPIRMSKADTPRVYQP